MGFTFSKADASRIADAVRRSESSPFGDVPEKRGHKPRGGGFYDYPGPFKVVQKDDTNITVEGYNVTEGREWRNYIDAGLDAPLELAEQDLAIAATGWVYLALTQTSNVYDVPTIATAATLPTQDNEHVYIRIAYVVVESGAISDILQWWYGGMALPGGAF